MSNRNVKITHTTVTHRGTVNCGRAPDSASHAVGPCDTPCHLPKYNQMRCKVLEGSTGALGLRQSSSRHPHKTKRTFIFFKKNEDLLLTSRTVKCKSDLLAPNTHSHFSPPQESPLAWIPRRTNKKILSLSCLSCIISTPRGKTAHFLE